MQMPRGPVLTWENGKHALSHVTQVELVNHAIPQTLQCYERTLEELADVNGLGDELEETLLSHLP